MGKTELILTVKMEIMGDYFGSEFSASVIIAEL